MKMRTTCPACDGDRLAEIYWLAAIPVQSCVLLASRDDAKRFPRRPLALALCDECGFIFNAIFDREMIDYAAVTEESQHFSGTFDRFARELVAEIAATSDLAGCRTLEIGCGKGDFLQELVRATGTSGLGVDPGFIPERLPSAGAHDVTFRREVFDPRRIDPSPDFVVCRHTLEHIDDVGSFMADVAAVCGGREHVGLFFETPDVARVLAEGAFWDIYYEHCSYFTAGAHARLFRRAGFAVTRLYLAYDDQYIIQYARPGAAGLPLAIEDDLQRARSLAADFPGRVAGARKRWTEFVRTRRAQGRRVVVWGGVSKGVAFITSIGLDDDIVQVVDINPFKQGKFIPGAGSEVIAPETLVDEPPDTVIAMNRIYLPEIRATLTSLGLEPELVAV